MMNLPEDILLTIFSMGGYKAVLNLGVTSKTYQKATSSNIVWGALIKRDIPEKEWNKWLGGTHYVRNTPFNKDMTPHTVLTEGLCKEIYRRILSGVDCDYLIKCFVFGPQKDVEKIIRILVNEEDDSKQRFYEYDYYRASLIFCKNTIFKFTFWDGEKEKKTNAFNGTLASVGDPNHSTSFPENFFDVMRELPSIDQKSVVSAFEELVSKLHEKFTNVNIKFQMPEKREKNPKVAPCVIS